MSENQKNDTKPENQEEEKEKEFYIPNQVVSLLEPKSQIIQVEKSMFKNYSKYSIANLAKVYFYENPIYSKVPEKATSKPPQIYTISFSKDPKVYAAGFSNGEIHIFEELIRKIVQYTEDTILGMRFHPEKYSVLITVDSSGHVNHTHSSTAKILSKFQIEEEKVPRCMDISGKGEKFAIGFADGEVNLYDESTQTFDRVFRSGTSFTTGHLDQIHSVVFDKSDNNVVLTGGRDKRILLWDVRTSQCSQMVVEPLILGDAVDIRGNNIICGSYDTPGNVYVYDKRNFKTSIKTIRTNTLIYCCKFNKKEKGGDYFAIGGYRPNALRYFKLNDEIQCGIDGCDPVYALDFSNDGSLLAYGCSDGGIRLANL